MKRIIYILIISSLQFFCFVKAQNYDLGLPPCILFVHGLAGDETTWKEFIRSLDKQKYFYASNYKILEAIDFSVSEEIKTQSANTISNSTMCPIFTITFTDNQNLSFQEQGVRLRNVIDRIINSYPHRKVILFGHSMGGLASRACINQNSSGIGGLVTVGTPHGGSFLAYFPKLQRDLRRIGLKELAGSFDIAASKIGLNLSSKAIGYLAPDSPELMDLNRYRFSEQMPLVNVISQWDLTSQASQKNKNLAGFGDLFYRKMVEILSHYKTEPSPVDIMSLEIQLKKSDGVVSVPSQYIKSSVPNAADLNPEVFFTDRFHIGETEDLSVMQQALDKILELVKSYMPPNLNLHKPTIGFILDSSSSMKDSDPNDIRKSAVEQIIDLLNGNENVFLIDFDHNSKWLNPTSWNNWDKEELKAAIRTVNSDGNTNVGLGLKTMREAMETNITDFSHSTVVLLTDGLGAYKNESEWFAQKGIKIYTVSYKDKADAKLLSSIAGGTGGIYLQANNENETVAAFMQFFNDLQGNSKFISHSGFFQGQKLVKLPDFYVDNNCKYLTVNINWNGTGKIVTLISPSGIKYSSNQTFPQAGIIFNNTALGTATSISGPHITQIESIDNDQTGPAKWTMGNNYLVAKIDSPESGKWNAVIENGDGSASNDSYLFEAGGASPSFINLDQNQGISGFSFKLDAGNQTLDLTNSIASIEVITPENKKVDISKSFGKGSFSFFPSYGKGNYTILVNLLLKDKKGNYFQRQYTRSLLVGDIMPGYMSPIKGILGNYLETGQGLQSGNRPGIKCFIYSPGASKNTPKALGYIQNVIENKCTVKVTQIMSPEKIAVGDIVELDLVQWSNDKK